MGATVPRRWHQEGGTIRGLDSNRKGDLLLLVRTPHLLGVLLNILPHQGDLIFALPLTDRDLGEVLREPQIFFRGSTPFKEILVGVHQSSQRALLSV